jgi:PAS domain S-box-containing protein
MSSTLLLGNDELLNVLSLCKDATAIHVTEKANIQFANKAMLAFWDKDESVIGLPLEDALPELKGQPFGELFARVWREGVTESGTDTPAQLMVDGKLETFYFDFEYRAVKNDEGKTICILHTAKDVTERVLGLNREQALTEELRASNEELLAANEELNASNEELSESHQSIRRLYDNLAESDSRFRNMVKKAPVGICMIRANDLFIQEVNDVYLELVGKERDKFENRRIWDAVPEAADTYGPIMRDVIMTGIPFAANSHELVLIRKGIPETVFVDFVYEPVRYNGIVDTIMVLCIEVTEKVKSLRQMEEMEERIRLAVEAAEIGTYDLDLNNKVMLTSDRFNRIFGFDRNVEWDEFTAAIHPEDRDKRLTAYREAYKSGTLVYEARVIHPDESIHWIRVQGKVYFDKAGKPIRILGTLLDISGFKRLEQQKDDFISIASHELKTPITSLKASLQLLERMKNNPSPVLLPKLIEQSGRSMNKISALVDELLNVSRANKSQLRLNKTNFNISQMLDDCCIHVRIADEQKLVVEGDKALTVFADEHAIDQVISNFVNNAVKYAPESNNIYLIVNKEDDMVKVSVKDTGPGIPAEKLPHLFDRYYQAEAMGFQSSGLGLGLYISAEIIRKHGGEIGVESKVGEGSTFWFKLPAN